MTGLEYYPLSDEMPCVPIKLRHVSTNHGVSYPCMPSAQECANRPEGYFHHGGDLGLRKIESMAQP